MTNVINVSVQTSSNVYGTECYVFASGNVMYDLEDQANIDAIREFVITNKGTASHTGITKLTSNVTALDFCSGQGQEEFKGIVTQSFADLQSNDQDNITTNGYVNYMYCAIQDAVNRSLWTIAPASSSVRHYMILFMSSNESLGSGLHIHIDASGSHVKTTNGTIALNNDNNIVTKSVAYSTNKDLASGALVRCYDMDRLAGEGAVYIGECVIVKVDSASPITGLYLTMWTGGSYNYGNLNVEFKSQTTTGEIQDVQDAVLRSKRNISTVKFKNYANYQTIMDQFGPALPGSGLYANGMTFDFPL